jgi:hypothetical protein
MDFIDFTNKVEDGFTLIPLIKELDAIEKEAIDVYSEHFDQKNHFFSNLLKEIKIGVDIQ